MNKHVRKRPELASDRVNSCSFMFQILDSCREMTDPIPYVEPISSTGAAKLKYYLEYF